MLFNQIITLYYLSYNISLTHSKFLCHHTKLTVADVDIRTTGYIKSKYIPSFHKKKMRQYF